jgi:outer membrane immunogenic protein
MPRHVVVAVTTAALGLGLVQTAAAADMPVKAPVAPVPVVSEWTGPYVGLAVGAKWTDATWTTTQISDPPSIFVGTAVIDASSPAGFDPRGFRIGGYAGYMWQARQWVFGIEGDVAWSDATETRAGVPGCAIECFVGFPGPGVTSSSVSAQWDASLRVRAGYLLTPETLVYGTGGVAWQHIEVSGTCSSTAGDPLCLEAPPFTIKTQTDSYSLTGWTIGGGVERRFGAWLLRGEYRYSDYGSVDGVLFPGQPAIDPGADALHYSIDVRTHTATLGLGYKF